MRRRVERAAGVFLWLGAVAVCDPAGAETLRSALLKAYRSNPDLTAARARLRAIDENVAIARSFGRPQASASASVTQQFDDLPRFRDRGRTLTGSAGVSHPFYQGGRVRYAVRAADARVIATREDLRALEGDIFAGVVTVYLDVIRDAYTVALNDNQVTVLEADFTSSRARFEVGDLTRTDVAQSEARLANARAQLVLSQGSLTRSREAYRRIVGDWPVDLELPPPLPVLPLTAEDAVTIGLANAPALAANAADIAAAASDVAVAAAERSPILSATASLGYTNYLGSEGRVFAGPGAPGDQSSASLGLGATLPIYQGGRPAARVRQARALVDAEQETGVGVQRDVVARVRTAFSDRQVAVAAIRAGEAAVAANALALRGTRAENNAGTRLFIDVLNAQQELLISEVTLVASRRDEYVAGFNLLNAMGRGDLASLDLSSGALYDPLPNYERARRSASDRADGVDAPTMATPIVGPTAIALPATAIRLEPTSDAASEAATIARPPIGDPSAPPRP